MANDQPDNKKRQAELDRYDRLIRKLREAGYFDDSPDFYADILRLLDKAFKQLKQGKRADEIFQGDLVKRRLENQFGDLDELEDELEQDQDQDEEESRRRDEDQERDQGESQDELGDELRRRRRQRKRRSQRQRSKPKEPQPKTRAAKPAPRPAPSAGTTTAGAGGAAAGSGAGAAAGGEAAAGGTVVVGGVAVEGWVVLVVILVVVIVILIIWLIFGGATNKALDEAGGSVMVSLKYDSDYDKQLVGDVLYWTTHPLLDPRLEVAIDAKADLNWQTREDQEDGDGQAQKYHKLDKRVMETLRYLLNDPDDADHPGKGWSKLGVRLLTNGPEITRRTNMAVNRDEDHKIIDTFSAYQLGQSIAIDQIGKTSLELTVAMCLAKQILPPCLPTNIRVGWQLTTADNWLRPRYEQLQFSGASLFRSLNVLAGDARGSDNSVERLAAHYDKSVIDESETDYDRALTALDTTVRNLVQVGITPLLNVRTYAYFARAIGKLKSARANLKTALDESTEDFIREWGRGFELVMPSEEGINDAADGGILEEDEEVTRTYQLIRDGLQFAWQGMQVANMVGWRFNLIGGLKYWKAYEARNNVRKLVVDLLRMPVDIGGTDSDFDATFIVKQLVVFSPEDDLDNGLPDLDVYPAGIVAVDGSGVRFDDSDKDGKIDIKDDHFASLPIDNGVFSKACATFVYQYDLGELAVTDRAGDVKVLFDLAPNLLTINKMCSFLYGLGTGNLVGTLQDAVNLGTAQEMPGRVTYRKFVHIAF